MLTWIQTQIRGLFAGINYCIYSLIEWIMYGIFDIASLEINSGLLNDIYTRIYAFLGVFMVFKITISLLRYVADPDSMVDKQKGVGKLATNTVVMLCLLLVLPRGFSLLREAQHTFLPLLPYVILGESIDSDEYAENSAEVMTLAALRAFYSPCSSCSEADRPDPISSVDDMMNTYGDRVNGQWAYDFNYIWALVVGGFMAILLLVITVKIGIRMIKMFVLEMIAPVPVMSYIDPKSAKDGAFASWLKQLISTFFDLFIRLGVVYIVVMLIKALSEGRLVDMSSITDPVRLRYIEILLIIALLMFAKDAPNFIKDAFGIKHDKDTSGVLAGFGSGALGFGTGLISGAISGRGIRGAWTGAVTGASVGFQSGLAGKKSNAWQAAGDASLQARTADPHAKSGVLAALQASATKSQLSREARKLNLTDDTLKEAKENMIYMQGLAAKAEDNLRYGESTGIFRDLEGHILEDDENGTAYEKAQRIKDTAASQSTIATKNYEKANKAGDSYKINRSFSEDFKKDKKDAKVDFKRGKSTKSQYQATGRFNPNKGVKTEKEIDRSS